MSMTAAEEAESAAAHVAAIVRRSGTSFYWGMRVLPPERRRAMYAVYAFCRAVDDIADEPGDLVERRQRLEGWRTEIDRLYSGEAAREPISRALLPAIRTFGLPRSEFEAVVDGMRTDLEGLNVAPSLAQLRLYCRRVAGAVGLLSIRCFGASGPHAEAMAIALGEALQLTNILRDLGEDADNGRLYIPEELLARHGIPARDPATVLDHPGLPPVCRDLAAIARERYRQAGDLIALCDQGAMRPVMLMTRRYEALLGQLEEAGWRQPRRRISLSKWRSLLLMRHLIA